jgi:hypothetical protein
MLGVGCGDCGAGGVCQGCGGRGVKTCVVCDGHLLESCPDCGGDGEV